MVIIVKKEQNLLLLCSCSSVPCCCNFSLTSRNYLLFFFFSSSVRAAPEHVPCGQQQQQQRTRLISFRDFMRLRDLRQFCMADPSPGDTPLLSASTTPPRPIYCPRSLHCRHSLCQLLLQFPHFISNLFIVLFSPAYFILYFLVLFFIFLRLSFLRFRFSFCPTAGLEMMPAELTEDTSSNTPNLVIIGISLAAFGFLLVNAALVAWFFVHQRRKKGSLTFHCILCLS